MFCSDVYCLVVNKSKGSFDTRYSGKASCAAKKMYKIIRGLEEKLNFRTTSSWTQILLAQGSFFTHV